MKNDPGQKMKPLAFGFAIPVMAALFISLLARVPRAGQSEETALFISTVASAPISTGRPATELEGDYLTSPAAQSASRRAEDLRAGRDGAANEGGNPFLYPEVRTPPPRVTMVQTNEPITVTNEIPTLELTAIIGGRRKIAVINGNLLQEGQQVVAGWTITMINSAERTVVVVGPGGTEILLSSK